MKRSPYLIVTAVMIPLMAFAACAPNNGGQKPGSSSRGGAKDKTGQEEHVDRTPESKSVNVAVIELDKSLDPTTKASKLADAAEELLTAQGYNEAKEVTDLALKADPQNLKARFLQVLLAPSFEFKGFYGRMKGLATTPELQKKYDAEMQKIELRNGPNDWLREGPADFKTESDVQTQIDKISESFGKLREFARDSKDQELKLSNAMTFFAAIPSGRGACSVSVTQPLVYQIQCSGKNPYPAVKMNRADWEGLHQMAAAYQFMTLMMNAYDLTGSVGVAGKHLDTEVAPRKQILEELVSESHFGKLRASEPSKAFEAAKKIGADVVAAARWILDNQKQLCARGTQDPSNRPGYLLAYGYCVTAANETANLDKAEKALKGEVITIDMGKAKRATQVKPMAFLENPIRDLRTLTPIETNACDQVISVADASLGGLLPQSDYNDVLKQQECGK